MTRAKHDVSFVDFLILSDVVRSSCLTCWTGACDFLRSTFPSRSGSQTWLSCAVPLLAYTAHSVQVLQLCVAFQGCQGSGGNGRGVSSLFQSLRGTRRAHANDAPSPPSPRMLIRSRWSAESNCSIYSVTLSTPSDAHSPTPTSPCATQILQTILLTCLSKISSFRLFSPSMRNSFNRFYAWIACSNLPSFWQFLRCSFNTWRKSSLRNFDGSCFEMFNCS